MHDRLARRSAPAELLENVAERVHLDKGYGVKFGRGLRELALRGRGDVERDVAKTEEEWREQLTPEQFRILRRRGTESAFSGEAVAPDAQGLYRCAACDGALFDADTKFDSGTGWPSFTDTVPDGVEMRRDFSLGIPRTEVRCRRCGGHLGHVFGDGPAPTRKRYCINGGALACGAPDANGKGRGV